MASTQNLPNNQTAAYFATIESLTIKEVSNTKTQPAVDSSFSWLLSPWLAYGSVIIFFVFFCTAMVIQIINRVNDWKKTATTLMVALLLASIPLGLRLAIQTTSLQTRAGPDEVPRSIIIRQVSGSSVEIIWETIASKTGAVRFGIQPLIVNQSLTVIGDQGQQTKNHRVFLENLRENVSYEFEILSGSTWYNNQGKYLNFYLK